MTEKEMELVRKFKSLVEQKLHVHEMIVFGSRARGDADPESDLDILLVVEEPETNEVFEFVSGCGFDAGLEAGIVINSTVFSRDEWEHGPERFGLLVLAIKKEGIPV